MEETKYQVMPDLTKEERERLKEDIKENGLEMPIDVDENGNILDGHERKSICDELGIPCEKTVHPGMSEEEKFDFAIRVNVNRRHLTQEQMSDVTFRFYREHPDMSHRAVADAVGVDDHTVKNAIAKITENNNDDTDECPGAEIPHVDTVKGLDGKSYPADAEKAEQQREAVRNAIADDPGKSDRQVARETGASPSTVGAQRKKMRSFHNPSARDEKALQDPDIVRRLSENDKLNVAGAIREQKRDRLAEKQDAGKDKGIDVIITPVDDITGVAGCRIVRAGTEEDPDSKAEMYNMDCLEYMKNVPDGSVDLIIADPPYFEVYGEFDFIWGSEAEYLEWIHKCLREFSRILKPTGTLMLWGTLAGNHLTLCKVMLWIEENRLFVKKNAITQRNTRGTGVKNNYMNCREDLLFYTKSDSYTFNIPYTDEISDRADLGANGKPRENDYKRASNVWCDITEASQSSIERCFHPTTKPLKACDRIVQSHSSEGDLVYIPFTGSGSEIVSCIRNGRQFIGTEIDEDYFNKSVERINKLLSM